MEKSYWLTDLCENGIKQQKLRIIITQQNPQRSIHTYTAYISKPGNKTKPTAVN